MPNRHENSSQYRYSFNTQEKVDEISGEGNHTTALYWEYDTRLGRRWNQDPKPNPMISNYATFANNPILFSDYHGDTVKVDTEKLYQVDDDGNYVNYEQALAFEDFLSTKAGKNYILENAEKGFSFTGEITGISIKASKDGKNSNTVSVTFGLSDGLWGDGSTSYETKDGILIMRHDIATNFAIDKYYKEFGSKTVQLASFETWNHETLLHGNFIIKKVNSGMTSDLIKSTFGQQHSNAIFKQSTYGDIIEYNLNWYNKKINAGHSESFIWYNMILPSLGQPVKSSIKN
jgi:uncharacterized protein YrzB (UPF0473 family)